MNLLADNNLPCLLVSTFGFLLAYFLFVSLRFVYLLFLDCVLLLAYFLFILFHLFASSRLLFPGSQKMTRTWYERKCSLLEIFPGDYSRFAYVGPL